MGDQYVIIAGIEGLTMEPDHATGAAETAAQQRLEVMLSTTAGMSSISASAVATTTTATNPTSSNAATLVPYPSHPSLHGAGGSRPTVTLDDRSSAMLLGSEEEEVEVEDAFFSPTDGVSEIQPDDRITTTTTTHGTADAASSTLLLAAPSHDNAASLAVTYDNSTSNQQLTLPQQPTTTSSAKHPHHHHRLSNHTIAVSTNSLNPLLAPSVRNSINNSSVAVAYSSGTAIELFSSNNPICRGGGVVTPATATNHHGGRGSGSDTQLPAWLHEAHHEEELLAVGEFSTVPGSISRTLPVARQQQLQQHQNLSQSNSTARAAQLPQYQTPLPTIKLKI